MVRFIEIMQPLMKIMPEVKNPDRKVSFKEKAFWTILALILYLIMSQIPLYGIPRGQEGYDFLFYLRAILASNRGTLMELGIGPIVTAGLIMQLLVGSQIIKVDFTDPEEGTDLNIITTEGELNGRVYRQVSAITAIGKSKLHSDKYVAEAWLNDDTTWRDVFKPKQAPGITPEQYLELVAEGNAPYWDDTDPQNKHWVFPNHPKLEEAANTRSRTFDEADDGENFEQASDLTKEPSVTIGNIKPEDVGEPKTENAVDVGAEALNESPTPENVDENETSDVGEEVQDELADVDNYDDLPF